MASVKMAGVEVSGSTQYEDNTAGHEKHLRLAGVVKGVHAKLRKKFKKVRNHYTVWQEHCQNSETLKEYANAMHQLATEIWGRNPQSRIDWCHKTCIEYFFKGALEHVLNKEKRREMFAKYGAEITEVTDDEQTQQRTRSRSLERTGRITPQINLLKPNVSKLSASVSQIHNNPRLFVSANDTRLIEDCNQSSETRKVELPSQANLDRAWIKQEDNKVFDYAIDPNDIFPEKSISISMVPSLSDRDDCLSLSDYEMPDTSMRLSGSAGYLNNSESPQSFTYRKPVQFNHISLPFEGKVRLLDVGSCYNAFQQFTEFLALGIDIMPAVESVLRCDFLQLETVEPLQLADDAVNAYLHNLKTPIETLPSEMFHVVVFSLLLEYFPSTYQRWICCQKAHKLLALNGILIIITPDSKHQNYNAAMIKSWNTAIESIGFVRWKYSKLEHIHCLVFRKVPAKYGMTSLLGEGKPDMLYIPQDFQDEQNSDDESNLDTFLCSSPTLTVEDMISLKQGFEELPSNDDSD